MLKRVRADDATAWLSGAASVVMRGKLPRAPHTRFAAATIRPVQPKLCDPPEHREATAMPLIPSSSIKWNGVLTIPQLTANLFKRQRTVLRLPTSYHPLVSARLYRNSRARNTVDLVG